MKRILLLIFLVSKLLIGRDILIGDRINLAISGSSVSEIKEAFQDFEIEDIDRVEDGYNIGLRSYSAGNHLIELGGRRLIISVKTSLDETKTKDIPIYKNPSSGRVELTNRRFPTEFLIGLISTIFLIFFILLKNIRRKKETPLNPKEKFHRGLESLGAAPFHEISHLLREYVDHIRGTNLLSGKYNNEDISCEELTNFLYELDHIKFSNKEINSKDEVIEKAKKLAKDIEDSIEVKEETDA